MEMTNGADKTIDEQMRELREKDSSFGQMVSFIEMKIEAQIETYNNTKTLKENYPNCASIKFTMPAFPMTPAQRFCLKEYFKEKYAEQTSGKQIRIVKCFFGKKYKITTEEELLDNKTLIEWFIDLLLLDEEDFEE